MRGMTLRRVTDWTSSMATKFRGSAMAIRISVRVTRMGTTECFFAIFLGRIWAISEGML